MKTKLLIILILASALLFAKYCRAEEAFIKDISVPEGSITILRWDIEKPGARVEIEKIFIIDDYPDNFPVEAICSHLEKYGFETAVLEGGRILAIPESPIYEFEKISAPAQGKNPLLERIRNDAL